MNIISTSYMKTSFLKRLGFTLIELLVVISIIGILASLAIPAVTGALVRGQMTGTLNNARQLQLATFNANLDQEMAGDISAWPGTNRNFTDWTGILTNGYLSPTDLRKLFAAPRIVVADPPVVGSIAFLVFQVGNQGVGEDSVFLATKNWPLPSGGGNPALSPTTDPYQDKGFVIMRRGGDGGVFQGRQATNSNQVFTPTNQPGPLTGS
jgi:prepilin-type N-terminal cleavage/methylation domain-containing protein